MAWMGVGFLPFVLAPLHLYVAPVSWAAWPGFVKGLEVSLLDAVALAILIGHPRNRLFLPFKLPFLFYILAVLLSAFQANVPQAALFYAWQLARMFLLAAAIATACEDERAPRAILAGLVIGLGVQAALALVDRFTGSIQTGGAFGHQNLLGMASHLVALPALALLMAGGRGWVPLLGPAAGVVTAIAGASRATIGLFGIGFIGVVLLTGLRKWTKRKGVVALLSLLALAAVAPLASNSLERRFSAAPIGDSYDERGAFEDAARMIIRDYPMGVGANQYVIVANTSLYLDEAGVVATRGSRAAHVHNVYLLAAAETGYLGLVALLALIAWPMAIAFRHGWRHRHDERGELMLGLGTALVIVSLHSFYEWIFVSFEFQYVFAVALGLIAGLAYQPSAGPAVRSTAAPPADPARSLLPIRSTPRIPGSRPVRPAGMGRRGGRRGGRR